MIEVCYVAFGAQTNVPPCNMFTCSSHRQQQGSIGSSIFCLIYIWFVLFDFSFVTVPDLDTLCYYRQHLICSTGRLY